MKDLIRSLVYDWVQQRANVQQTPIHIKNRINELFPPREGEMPSEIKERLEENVTSAILN